MVPSELKAWAKVSRLCAVCFGPSSEISGLATTWTMVMPLASTNSATRKSPNAALAETGTNSRQPAIIVSSPTDGAAHVAHAPHQRRAGQGDDEIGGEKGGLHQHGLHMVEREQLLELGDDDVVEAGDAAEDEKQRHDENAQFRRVDRRDPPGSQFLSTFEVMLRRRFRKTVRDPKPGQTSKRFVGSPPTAEGAIHTS